jgi:hypothetical protein
VPSALKRWALSAIFALCLLSAIGPGKAHAAVQANQRPLLFAIDGSSSSLGGFTAPLADAIDEKGLLYVVNGAGEESGPGPFDDERVVCRFDLDGNSVPFSAGAAAGQSCLNGTETGGAFGTAGSLNSGSFLAGVAVDNSAGSGAPGEGEQGRFYVAEETAPVHAFAPDGSFLWSLQGGPSSDPPLSQCGIAVDHEGHLFAGDAFAGAPWRFRIVEFASEPPNGSPPHTPPEEIGSIELTHATKRACRLAVDRSGKSVYAGLAPELPSGLDRYVEGHFDSSAGDGFRTGATVDQSKSDGHVFDATATSFSEHETCAISKCFGSLVAGSPFGLDLIGNSAGIAYDAADDRVYVPDRASASVKVFGPITSGTTPDVSCQVSSPVVLHSLTANCTINPLNLPNAYHFEWKEGTGGNWGVAESSPEQSIAPSDGSPHAVSLAITHFRGRQIRSNTTYQVRLVGSNDEAGKNHLSSYSNADTVTTLVPPAAGVSGCAVSAVSTTSAHLSCLVDTKEEETSWRVLTNPLTGGSPAACGALADAEFSLAEEGTIPAEEAAPAPIATDLVGLDPAQFYCVRVVVENPGGGDAEDVDFNTTAVPPAEAGAAFTAPRTDTTAQINARVNPNGEADFKYRFEWSEDGVDWTALPVRESSLDARAPIVIADRLAGLSPGTTYRYRLGLIENAGGAASSLGGEKTFTTRSKGEVEATDPPSCANEAARIAQHTAGYLGSCRGIELVSEPDKGNQNASANGPGVNVYNGSPLTSDGGSALWSVLAGAPKGTSGNEATFLAKRGDGGWQSQSISPPASQQFGGGEFAYLVLATTPSFECSLFSVRYPTKLSRPALETAVRVCGGKQDVLKSYGVEAPNTGTEEAVDLSDDGAHVFALNAENKQLEDIGSARVGVPGADAEVVSVMPDGQPSECGLDVEAGLSFKGLAGGGIAHAGNHWVATNDGSRVFFRAKPNDDEVGGGSCDGDWRLYLRNRDQHQTTLIDSGSPEFVATGGDGRRAYFVTRSSLDPGDSEAGSLDLYEWVEPAGTAGEASCLTCAVQGPGISGGSAHLAAIGGGINSVLVSPDLSSAYFYSLASLLPGAGRAGSLNLYLLRDGVLHYVTTTDEDVLSEGAETSSDGRELLFTGPSSPLLTADEMAPQCESPAQGEAGPCRELYRYELGEESLECVSCNHDGTTTHSFGAARLSISPDVRLSGDGSTAAFPTKEALVEDDVNGDTDLYEWRAGTAHLLTDGISDFQEGASAPWVWAVDQDGSNILFGLVPPNGSLTGFERDGVLNLYDARAGGGFVPPAPVTGCEGDSCQGPLASAPAAITPASAGYEGRGNLGHGRKPCGKGKVRRKGRCTRLHARGRHHKSANGHGKGGNA